MEELYLDIILIISNYLDLESIINFMKCNKYLYDILSKSKIWIKYNKYKPRRSLCFYKEQCDILKNNSIIKNVYYNEKYSDEYYCTRFFKLRKYLNFNLRSILKSTKHDLLNTEGLIHEMYYYHRNNDYIKQYNYIIQNYDVLYYSFSGSKLIKNKNILKIMEKIYIYGEDDKFDIVIKTDSYDFTINYIYKQKLLILPLLYKNEFFRIDFNDTQIKKYIETISYISDIEYNVLLKLIRKLIKIHNIIMELKEFF